MIENIVTSRLRVVRTRAVALIATAAVATSLAIAMPTAAQAETAPIDSTPVSVTTDALPTAQIDGIVWVQKLVGNTVYAGGKFTKARPAGAAKGSQEVTRNNLIAYDVTTGVMTSFAPDVNAQIRAIGISADQSTLYIGGDFTTVNGQPRNRLAAFNLATKQLTSWAPNVNSAVRGLDVTSSAVYFTGTFGQVNGNTRTRAAAVSIAGALLPWAPVLNDSGQAIKASPDGKKVVIGGAFTTLNGSGNPGYGMGMVDATSGALLPFQANNVVRNGGANAAILSLAGDGDSVYGSGYVYGAGGNLEGVFRADWATGNLVWAEDCHGDTYNVAAVGDLIYETGHAHYCGSIVGGFPQSDPWTVYRGLAFTKAVERITPSGLGLGYYDWGGNPAPKLTHWFPTFDTGTVSGAGQGTWSVAGNSQYVVYGGEFNRVNNKGQQGLVRFATSAIAPDTDGPRLTGAAYVPTGVAISAGKIRVSWPLNWDRDNEFLKYEVVRDGQNATPVHTVTARSKSADWGLPGLSFTDTVPAGSTHTYRVRVSDPFNNQALSDQISVTANGSGVVTNYSEKVIADKPLNYWPLNDTGATNSYDWAGAADLTVNSGVTRNTAGALVGETAPGSTFNGTSTGFASTKARIDGPQTFGLEAWFKTTTTSGGKIIGFGSSSTGTSGSYDRHVFMNPNGTVTFGVYPGSSQTITTAKSYNDGQYHQVSAGLSSAGMVLYIDGLRVAARSDVVGAQGYSGYWRVGGDNSWNGAPFFAGSIDEVAVYSAPLTNQQVASHFVASGRSLPGAPTASFTAAATNKTVSVNAAGSTDPDGTIAGYAWNWGDSTAAGSGVTATHNYAIAGTYTVTLTVTDNSGLTGTTTRTVTVTDPPPPANAAPTASFTTTMTNKALSVNAAGSTDSDGTIVGYAWNWGDSTAAGSGVTATHNYVNPGSYTVTLTVTDNGGLSATTTRTVTASDGPPPPAGVVGSDDFTRTVAGGWGTATVGGAWTVAGGASFFSVDGAGGIMSVAAGTTRSAYLAGVSAPSANVTTAVTLPQLPVGSSVYASVLARRVGTEDYRARAVVSPAGGVQLQIQRTATTLVAANIAGLTLASGETLMIRTQAVGSNPTTINAKVWKAGTAEPAAWQLTTTDATAALQTAGSVGVSAYLGGSVSNVPYLIRFDDLVVTNPTA